MPHTYTSVDSEHPPHRMATVLRWAVVDRLLGRRAIQPPGPPAPRVEADLDLLATPARAPRVTWIGHASFLVQLAGASALIDPVLSSRLGTYRRHAPPGLTLAQLPPIDVLLISHSHYDHLDEPTVRGLPRDTPVVVPEGLGRFFTRRGFHQVHELLWWQQTSIGPLRLTLVPARHWSRRGLFDLNDSLWGGWVVEPADARTTTDTDTGPRAVLHAGDSATFPDAFREIGERFDVDVALLPIGAYEPGWFMEHAHMTPEQAGESFELLGARAMVPMHWGTFQLTDEPIAEPIERLRTWWRRHRPRGSLHALAIGETLDRAPERAPSAMIETSEPLPPSC